MEKITTTGYLLFDYTITEVSEHDKSEKAVIFMTLLSTSLFAVILILATMFAGTETANAFDFIKGINYSPHMPGENCSEFGKANYSQDLEWMKRAKINTIRTKSDLTSPVIDDFEDACIYNSKCVHQPIVFK